MTVPSGDMPAPMVSCWYHLTPTLPNWLLYSAPPPKVIWLRAGNLSTETSERLLRAHAEAILAFGSDAGACLEIY